MKKRVLVVMFMLAAAVSSPTSRACTTFCFEDALVFGKNYDWNVAEGLVMVNKRGVAKQAFVARGALAWTSRYGSVTFNQYGREFPNGGINEKGLVIELMWLDDTEYPAPDARGALPTLQWIQYQLDNAATVDDVVASDRIARIQGASARIHFLVADAEGNTAAVEYLKGKMVVHRGARALTNDTYANSLSYVESVFCGTGLVTEYWKPSKSSLNRFRMASVAAREGPLEGTAPVDAAFDLLARVAQGEYTQWSIVYDIANRRVHFRTRAHSDVRWIDLAKLDFDCASPVRVIDLNAPFAGDVTDRLVDYTLAANRTLLGASYAATDFLRGVPAEALDELARFPEATRCAP